MMFINLILLTLSALLKSSCEASTSVNGSLASQEFYDFVRAIASSESHSRIIMLSRDRNMPHQLKWLNSMGHYVGVYGSLEGIQEPLSDKIIYFVNIDDFDVDNVVGLIHDSPQLMSTGQWYFIGSQNIIQDLMHKLGTKLDQKVFFGSVSSMEVFESYVVGETSITSNIGKVTSKEDQSWDFVLNANLPGFLARRSNLQGHSLMGFIKVQAPFIFMPHSVRDRIASNETEWFTLQNGLEYTNVRNEKSLTGMFVDILESLEKSMNFTAVLLNVRKDTSLTFGSKVNGTWDGIIGELVRGHADFIFASLTLTDKRFEAVDFLQPLGSETFALFVPPQGFDERQWLSFLYPLRPETWAFLAANAALLVILVKSFQISCISRTMYSLILNPKSVIGDFWMFFMSYIGRAPSTSYANSHDAIKILIMVALLAGNIVSMSYRASLTAALSVQKPPQPFKSIDEVIELEYR